MTNSLDRDIECGANFNRLLELGCFDREFIFCGYGYLENGHIRYCVSGREAFLYQQHQATVLKNIYPAPIVKKITRAAIPSGQEEAIKQQAKMELVDDLRTQYNRAYFEAVWQLAKEPAQNTAYPLLKALQEESEGRFRDEDLQLLEGLCWQALENKTLQYPSFAELNSWLEHVRRQMADDIIVKDRFERCFSGFGYESAPGKLAYYYDAQPHAVSAKRAQYQLLGTFVTPIYKKRCWFHNINTLSALRQQFAVELKQVIDSHFVHPARALCTLPSVYRPEPYQTLKEHVRESCAPQACQAFVGYGHRWLIE